MTKIQRIGLSVMLILIISLIVVNEHWFLFVFSMIISIIGCGLFIGFEDEK